MESVVVERSNSPVIACGPMLALAYSQTISCNSTGSLLNANEAIAWVALGSSAILCPVR